MRRWSPGLTPQGDDPGVPEALSRAVTEFLVRVPPRSVDRVWLFPPLRRGRREHGLVSASCFLVIPPLQGEEVGQGGEGVDRRVLVTLSYRAEETGAGIRFESHFQEEGEAPADRLPRIIAGVVRRSRSGPGEPMSLRGGGDPFRLAEALDAVGLAWTPLTEGDHVDGGPRAVGGGEFEAAEAFPGD